MEEVYYFDDESCILKMLEQMEILVNPFYATGPFLYPLKASKDSGFLMFSGSVVIVKEKLHETG